MSATALIIRLLLASDGVRQLAGSAIFPVVAPQGTPVPYLTVTVVGENAEYRLNGPSAAFDSRVTIACHGASALAAIEMGEAVKAALSSVVNREVTDGRSPAAVLGTITTWKTGTDFTDFSDDGSVYRRIMDFRARWVSAA